MKNQDFLTAEGGRKNWFLLRAGWVLKGGPSELGGEVSGDDEMEFTDSEEEERLEKLHPHSKQYRGARVKERKRKEKLHPSTVGNV